MVDPTPSEPPPMSDPPTPEELDAMRRYNLERLGDLAAQAVAASEVPIAPPLAEKTPEKTP